MKASRVTILLPLLATSCVSSAKFTKTGDYEASPRAANCEFSVYTANPDKPYKEVGTIEYSGTLWGGAVDGPSTVADAKGKAQESVCSSGGNGLILEMNGLGRYKKGTVIVTQ